MHLSCDYKALDDRGFFQNWVHAFCSKDIGSNLPYSEVIECPDVDDMPWRGVVRNDKNGSE